MGEFFQHEVAFVVEVETLFFLGVEGVDEDQVLTDFILGEELY